MLLFIGCGDDAMLDGDGFGPAPNFGNFDFVDAVSPCVPLAEGWFVETIGKLELIKFAAGEFAHLEQAWLDLRKNVRRNYPIEIGAKRQVVGVLVVEFGWKHWDVDVRG